MKDYEHSKEKYDTAMRMVAAKRKEMESFQRDADKAQEDMERHANQVRQVAKEL